MLKLTNLDIKNKSTDNLKKSPGILLNSLIHSNQKKSLVILFYIFSKLLFEPNLLQKHLLKHQTVYFIPFTNPDSVLEVQQIYKSSARKSNLNVRKNRNRDSKHLCLETKNDGVDINRNFDFHFAELGRKGFCHQQYGGAYAFSEKQSQILKLVIEQYNIRLAIDLHSYGDKLIYPYAYDRTGDLIKQNQEMWEYYSKMKQSLKLSNARMGSAFDMLSYIADGVYIDWIASKGIRSFAYQFGLQSKDDLISISESIIQCPLLDVIVKNSIWIIGQFVTQENRTFIKLKSLGYDKISINTPSEWTVKNERNENRRNETIIQLNYGEQILIEANNQTKNTMTLQIIDEQSSFEYKIQVNSVVKESNLYLIASIILIIILILAFIGALAFWIVVKQNALNQHSSIIRQKYMISNQSTIQELEET